MQLERRAVGRVSRNGRAGKTYLQDRWVEYLRQSSRKISRSRIRLTACLNLVWISRKHHGSSLKEKAGNHKHLQDECHRVFVYIKDITSNYERGVTVDGSLYWLNKRGLFHHALQFRRVDIDAFRIVENEKDLLKCVRRCLTKIFR